MAKRIVHTKIIKCQNETIKLQFGAFEWFAHNCEHRHAFGTDIPFATCNYKERGGDCCYQFCKKYKRNRTATTR